MTHQFAELSQFTGLLTEATVTAQCFEHFALFCCVQLIVYEGVEPFFGDTLVSHFAALRRRTF